MRAALLAVLLLAAGAVLPRAIHAAGAPPAGSAVAAAAPRCAASVEAAARGILGAGGTSVADGSRVQADGSRVQPDGFRVQDIVVDPVLRRAWVRVASCRDPRTPLTMVALEASVAGAGQGREKAFETVETKPESADMPITRAAIAKTATDGSPSHETWQPQPQMPAFSPPLPMLIASGQAVEVLVRSSNVHMTLQGHAASAAAKGEPIDVVLDSAPGDNSPTRHMRGVAATPRTVEVER